MPQICSVFFLWGANYYPLFLPCSSFFSFFSAPIKGSYFRTLKKRSRRPVDCQSTQLCSHRHWSDLFYFCVICKAFNSGCFQQKFHVLKLQPKFLGRIETTLNIGTSLPPRRYYLAPTPRLKSLFVGLSEKPKQKTKTTRFRIVKYKLKGQTVVRSKACNSESRKRQRSDSGDPHGPHGALSIEVGDGDSSMSLCSKQFV